jgi:hypothetical protein
MILYYFLLWVVYIYMFICLYIYIYISLGGLLYSGGGARLFLFQEIYSPRNLRELIYIYIK